MQRTGFLGVALALAVWAPATALAQEAAQPDPRAAQWLPVWPEEQPTLQAMPSTSPRCPSLGAVDIVEPRLEIPEAHRGLSGLWKGWLCEGRRGHVRLAVERVTSDAATIVYGFASDRTAHFVKRVNGTFVEDELRAELRRGGPFVVFRLRPDGALDGMWRDNSGFYSQWCSGVLERDRSSPEELAARAAVGAESAEALVGGWEGDYTFPETGRGGYTRLSIRSIEGDEADVTIEWRWTGAGRPGKNDYSKVMAGVLRDCSGAIIGIEPWRGSKLYLDGSRLVGDIKLRAGLATHTYERD